MRTLLTLAVLFGTAMLAARPRGSGSTPGTPGSTRPDGSIVTPDGTTHTVRPNTTSVDASSVSSAQSSMQATHLPNGRPRKKPGAPETHPHRRKRKLDDGTVLEIPKKGSPDRPKYEPEYTSGYADGLPDPVRNPDGSYTIHLRKHQDWDQADFDSKANHLKDLGEQGQLQKKTGDAEERGSSTSDWRRDKEYEILHTSDTQAEVNARLRELDSQQIDHAHELQLGGKDSQDNMWPIDAPTNHGMGGQINSQLSKVPPGSKVKIEII